MTAVPPAVPVDLSGPLPTGTTVLEASAGTGKTYTIAALVTQFVAEDQARLGELLVVTFGRLATSELRARIRERLAVTRDALADPATARASKDEVVARLARGSDAEVEERRDRLTAALAHYDAATIATIHQFCQEALRGLGVVADVDPGTTLREDLGDLVDEVCDDVYLRMLIDTPDADFPHPDARAVARAAALEDPQALLVPANAPAGSIPAFRVEFATAVRAETERRKRALRVQGFDDLLVRTRDALAAPVTGPAARDRLRDRFRVVLVDEFQDTDPVQWEVFRLAFHGVPDRALVLIGDPKQAIYGFRGGDVRTYLAAAGVAGTRATLGTNWRSDQRLLDGLQTVFRGAALGDPEIVVRPVRAGRDGTALTPADARPVQLRVLQRDGLQTVRGGGIQADAARSAVAADVAAQVRAVLDSGSTIAPRKGDPRDLTCGDLAVLVRTGTQALLVRDALLARGVPSVLTGLFSVFGSDAAGDWLLLLEALGAPHRRGLVRRLALTAWFGWSAAEIDERGSEATDELADVLRGWEQVFSRSGVAGLFAAVCADRQLPVRLLGRPDGERQLTDRRHVAEALHAEATRARLGLSGLLAWLRARVDEARYDQDEERARRLDTDAAAVQIVTVHASKGLEFPVVFVPFGWDPAGGGNRERLPQLHDADGRRVRHVGGKTAADYTSACQAEKDDSAGEELRLLYVAATRAVSKLVLWWAPAGSTSTSPLHRLLFTADPSADVPAKVAVPKADADALTRLRALAGAAPGGLDVVPVTAADAGDGGEAAATPADDTDLAAAKLTRAVDPDWRRTSYTGLTRRVHERPAAIVSEPEVAVKDDESDDVPAEDAGGHHADQGLRAVPSPMADLAGGAAFGTLVHGVLEDVLTTDGDPGKRLRAAAGRHLAGRTGGLLPEQLATALEPALATPLGALAGDRSLRDVAARDVLTELDFELALAGGDAPVAADVRLGDVAALLRDRLPAGDRMAGYPAALEVPELARQRLRGFLTGSLDAVLRVADGGQPRYVVVDHKTNRLADPAVPLTAWHYRPAALDAAMIAAHYPLQALLYQVALHRFLRWRQPDYVPAEHLGGVLYLFLRGMCGSALGSAPEGDVPGVWSWRPPASVVVELSDLLAEGTR
ncbi:exodeoxyribonuclease V beta subunit [Geodermatophilus tzadiensis]|uniref:RecBCD enzyme subunit RecB n=1 Tax=Geodermatophilus tzadiensis TaxID=1137988 RepID=A0A2T0T116_9ACTN|nr:UvrD-helicase domain-containing protein [Geodermatophilus tzadiensis]PRY39337.1 exodeoxyribonuclease V beta subunit [Geodermatophilus tzadiensis]